MNLVTQPNIADADGIYQQLIDIHYGRSDEDSMRVNARLILLLINHVGDPEAIGEAIRRAADAGMKEAL